MPKECLDIWWHKLIHDNIITNLLHFPFSMLQDLIVQIFPLRLIWPPSPCILYKQLLVSYRVTCNPPWVATWTCTIGEVMVILHILSMQWRHFGIKRLTSAAAFNTPLFFFLVLLNYFFLLLLYLFFYFLFFFIFYVYVCVGVHPDMAIW